MDKHLTDKQFELLPDDLKGLYIGFGVPLSKYIFDFVMSNGKLKKRYDEILKRRFDELLKGTEGIRFGGDEIIYALNNGMVDDSKLDGDIIYSLLHSTPKEQRYNLVKQIFPLVKDKLDGDIISNLLYYTPREQQYNLVQQIFPLVKDKLDSKIIYNLLAYTPGTPRYAFRKQNGEMVKVSMKDVPGEQSYNLVLQILPLIKNKLTPYMVGMLLDYTPSEQEYELIKQIIPLVNHNWNDNIVSTLLEYISDEHKPEIQSLINQYKQPVKENKLDKVLRKIK
jgi:hypothetical protein